MNKSCTPTLALCTVLPLVRGLAILRADGFRKIERHRKSVHNMILVIPLTIKMEDDSGLKI